MSSDFQRIEQPVNCGLYKKDVIVSYNYSLSSKISHA